MAASVIAVLDPNLPAAWSKCWPDNNSFDANGGSVFPNFLFAAERVLIRAADSTQP